MEKQLIISNFRIWWKSINMSLCWFFRIFLFHSKTHTFNHWLNTLLFVQLIDNMNVNVNICNIVLFYNTNKETEFIPGTCHICVWTCQWYRNGLRFCDRDSREGVEHEYNNKPRLERGSYNILFCIFHNKNSYSFSPLWFFHYLILCKL